MTAPQLALAEEAVPRSLADRAYQLLVAKITRLELPPGAVLVEKSLMENLGIGRTPIREALQRLAMEGLVTHLPNRGMLVADITATGVQHIYEFRGLIDGCTARLAAARATEADARELAELQAGLARATEDDDIDRYVDLDRRFYEVLARAAQNTYIAEAVPRIFNLHLRLWFFIAKRRGTWHDIARAHEVMTAGVVEAVKRRAPEAAEAAMTAYIAGRHQDIRELL
jgi:DNA-binding GntR family transcriptional regulator